MLSGLFLKSFLLTICVAGRHSSLKDDRAAAGQKVGANRPDFLADMPSLKGVSTGMSEADILDTVHREKLRYFHSNISATEAMYGVESRPDVFVVFLFRQGRCWEIQDPKALGDYPIDDRNDRAPSDTEIEAWAGSKAQLFLYSLNPGRQWSFVNTEDIFHGFKILGETKISSRREKNDLLKAFARGIRERDDAMMCFNPRHGLRVVEGSSTNDFLICFQCHLMKRFRSSGNHEFTISDSPATTFNNLLDKHHLTKADTMR